MNLQYILQISQSAGLRNQLDQCVFGFQAIIYDLVGWKNKAIVSIPTITELKCVTDGYAVLLVHPVNAGARPDIYSNTYVRIYS